MSRYAFGVTCAIGMCVAGSSGFSMLARIDRTIEYLGTANDQLITANAQLGMANQQLADMKTQLNEVSLQLMATSRAWTPPKRMSRWLTPR